MKNFSNPLIGAKKRAQETATYTTPDPNDLIELPAFITSNSPSEETYRKLPESPSLMIKLFTSKLSRTIASTTVLIESLSRMLHKKSLPTMAAAIIFSVLKHLKRREIKLENSRKKCILTPGPLHRLLFSNPPFPPA